MTNFKIKIKQNGNTFETLADILPANSGVLDILFIAKTPATKSVYVGHYFQGRQGQMFWNKLKDYNILKCRPGTYEDENLLDHWFGITDIVKKPRDFGNEPSSEEYKIGLPRILDLIKEHSPKVIVFVYKKVLDNILKWGHGLNRKSSYGLNKDLEKHFNCKVFVFPMPGTPCTKDAAIIAMNELKQLIDGANR